MSRFTVLRHQALHTGGTKFYQQVKIEDTKTGKAFLVQHWGKWLNNWDLKTGQSKVLKLADAVDADFQYREKWHEKQRGKPGKGHYEQHDLSTFRPDSISGLKEILIAELGAGITQVDSVVAHFGGFISDASFPKFNPDACEFPSPVMAGIGTKGDVPTTEGWGSW